MSRSSRNNRNQQYAVSLFPFMAVLICTLGVLIVMLVMAVQQADVEGRKQREEVTQRQNDELKLSQERQALADFQSESILSVREDLTTRLKIAKADRSYLEQQIDATDQQAEDLFKSIAELSALINDDGSTDPTESPDSASESEQDIDAELIALNKEIRAAQDNLKKLREDKSFQTDPEHAIIPFTGSGGTRRQPIFVECVSDGIILQPYGIKLRREEFLLPLSIGNMLDSALLTVRAYWEKHDLADADAKPYPLLVVRPQGALSYGLARRAMKSWDDEFGYELVDSAIKLRYGQPDLKLKSEIEAAITAAKLRQQRLARRRQLDQNDQWKNTLEVARGLKPSASGGFETVGTGRPAHEVLKTASFSKSGSADNFHLNTHATDHRHRPNDDRTVDRGQKTPSHQESSTTSTSTTAGTIDPQTATQASLKSLRQTENRSNQNSNQQSGQPNTNAAQQGRPPFSSSSLANTRGSNWALPATTTGAKAYVRPIRLVCRSDQISIVVQGSVTATIPFNGLTVAAVDPLVSEVWKTIESWGLAGKQAYWKPELRFSVMPGAQSRFDQLRNLLDDSGLLLGAADER